MLERMVYWGNIRSEDTLIIDYGYGNIFLRHEKVITSDLSLDCMESWVCQGDSC